MKHPIHLVVSVCIASACAASACSGAPEYAAHDVTETSSDEAEEVDSAISVADWLNTSREIGEHNFDRSGFTDFEIDNPCEDPPLSCQDLTLRESNDARVNVVISRYAATGRLLTTEVAVRQDSQFAQSISYESSQLRGRIAETPGPTFPIDDLRCELPFGGELEVFEDTYHIEMNRGTTYQLRDGFVEFDGPIRSIPAPGDINRFFCAPRQATLSSPGARSRTITLSPRLESVTTDPNDSNMVLVRCAFSMPANEYYVNLEASPSDYTRVEGNVFHASNDQLKNIMCLSDDTCRNAGGTHTECGADHCCAFTPF